MANALSLEERTMGFFLKQTDNVTCYGHAARENIIPFVGQEDYAILRDNVLYGGVLEHPEKEPYINLVDRNPFLGLTGEEAYAIHRLLRQTSADDFSMPTGLITYAGAPGEGGIYPFFLELGQKLKIYSKVQQGYLHALNVQESMFKDWKASGDVVAIRNATPNLKDISHLRKMLRARKYELSACEKVICDIFAEVTSDSLRRYVEKYQLE